MIVVNVGYNKKEKGKENQKERGKKKEKEREDDNIYEGMIIIL